MKKVLLILLSLFMCISLSACGKSKAAQEVDEKIQAIGTVSLESGDAIEEAENGYSKLTDKEKEQLDYYQTLVVARNKYDQFVETENTEKEQISNEIQSLIDKNKIKDAKEKIEEINDKYSDIKETLSQKIQEKCYSGISLLKFGEIVSNQPDNSKEGVDDIDIIGNYYYYSMLSDLNEAFDDYYDYLNENATKTSSENILFKLYNFTLDDREVKLILFDTRVKGQYMIQVSYAKE